jgi:hypothetical protein
MKRLAVLLAVLALPVAATDDMAAICQREDGCRLITNRAFEFLVGEVQRLQRVIAAIRKEQCT